MNWSPLVIVAILVAGCSPAVSATPEGSVGATSPATATEPAATVTLTPESSTTTPATTTTLSGQGDKTGPAVMLDGDYTISVKVIADAGCSWSLSFTPGYDNVVYLLINSPGSHEKSVPYSLAAGSYQLVVFSTNCGAWTVSLIR